MEQVGGDMKSKLWAQMGYKGDMRNDEQIKVANAKQPQWRTVSVDIMIKWGHEMIICAESSRGQPIWIDLSG